MMFFLAVTFSLFLLLLLYTANHLNILIRKVNIIMANLNDLTTAVANLADQVTRVEGVVNDLHNTQGVPESDLDGVLNGINDAANRLANIS